MINMQYKKLSELGSMLEKFRKNGVNIPYPENVWINNLPIGIGRGTIIHPNCYIIGGAHSTIGEDCEIGPNALLRGWFKIGDRVKIGFGAEIVRSTINDRSKAPHFCHIGDGIVGIGVNIAAGTIFCNYDGKNKNTTIIEDDVFIDAGTMLIPSAKRGLHLGRGCFIAAGSVIDRNVPAGHFIKMERITKTYENRVVVRDESGWTIVSQNCESLH